MYYIEPKGSDTIEMQEALSASDVIKRAMMFENVNRLEQAIQVLNKNGYMVFEDC